jgi:hypothetical protein
MVICSNSDYTATDSSELTFVVNDIIECIEVIPGEDWWIGKVIRTGQLGTFPISFTGDWKKVAALSVKKNRGRTRTSSSASRTSVLQMKLESKALTEEALTAFKTIMDKAKNGALAKVLYAYTATCEGELTITAGEIIHVLSKKTGCDDWWEGSGLNGEGQFPKSYVVELEEDGITPVIKETITARALYDFTPTSPLEIGFKAGDLITVRQSEDENWWDGEINGAFGAFPALYVERI